MSDPTPGTDPRDVAGRAAPSTPGRAVNARLLAHAEAVVDDPDIALVAARDALVVATAHGIDPDGDPEDRLRAWALTRNEALRQLRARSRFIDSDEVIAVPDAPLGPVGTVADATLAAVTWSCLRPGQRDALSLALAPELDRADVARIMGIGSLGAQARVASADASRRATLLAVVAILLDADAAECPGRAALVEESGGLITPASGAALSAHVQSCSRCAPLAERAKSVGNGSWPPGGVADAHDLDVMVRAVDGATREHVSNRAGAVLPFPEPLDAADRSGLVWVRRAVIAGGISALLLLVALLVALLP